MATFFRTRSNLVAARRGTLVAGLAVIGPGGTLRPVHRLPPPEVPRAYSHHLSAPRSRRQLAGRVPERGAVVAAPASHQRDATGLQLWRQPVDREPVGGRRATPHRGSGDRDRGRVFSRWKVGGVHRGV